MKNLPLLFCGIFFALAFSFTGLILSSNIQIGSLNQTTQSLDENGNNIAGETLYPLKTAGLAKQGKQVYIEPDERGGVKATVAQPGKLETVSEAEGWRFVRLAGYVSTGYVSVIDGP